MVIQALKPSQRVKGRWLAVLDSGEILRLGEGEVADFALYAGRELSSEEAAALQAQAKRSERREKALELLAGKPLSRRELERKLRQWGAGEDETAQLCDRLEELGYLDDARYAAQVAQHYAAKGFGVKKLRDELYRRGVPRELWDEALEQVPDPAGDLDAFLAKKLAGRIPDRQELSRLSAALARRGYRWSDVSDALRRYGADIED